MPPVVRSPAQVGVLPDPGTRAWHARWAALSPPRIGEGGRERWAGEVGDQPLLLPGAAGKQVDRDLQRSCQAHHPAPGRTYLVEHLLHRQVAAGPEPQRNFRAGVERVEADGLKPDAARRSDRDRTPQHPGEVTGKGPSGWPGRRAQLELATGFEGRGRRPDEACIESGREHHRVNRAGPRGVGHRDQLDLGPHAPWLPRRCEQPFHGRVQVHAARLARARSHGISAGTEPGTEPVPGPCGAAILPVWRRRGTR